MDTTSVPTEIHHAAGKGDSSINAGDKLFLERRSIVLQDINNTMDSILNGLNELNISLENSIAVGKEFESVTKLWKNFYNGLDIIQDDNDDSLEKDDVQD